MEKQKKLIELVFFGIIFIALVVFLIYNGIQPKEPSAIPVYEPPLIQSPMQSTPSTQTPSDNNEFENSDEQSNDENPLLPQNIPYWELD